jgi:UDP-N-acetylglucosamine--dolichyl-phosphate N-acetylglucosaminephosphotransferase
MNLEILIIILNFVIAFFICFGLTKWWISVARKYKLQGKDQNKYAKPLVSEAGGIAVVISIIISVMLYIFFKNFVLGSLTHFIEVLTLVVTLLLACFIGFIDDILGKDLAGWKKVLMTIIIAVPLMVINAGTHTMLGIEFGLIYPLVLIPIAMIGATNGYNLLAGYNGLEAGLGTVIFTVFGLIALVHGQFWLALIAGIIVLALLAFLVFNKFPAKVFPGDSLTYSLGALVACFAILGNMEKAALILFIPFIIEGILQARGRFKTETFGIPNKDNTLNQPYKKIYSIIHVLLRVLKKSTPSKKATELKVTNNLILLEIILALIVILISF